ncbi:ImmA/IrrE family metallo-endopeptidase [Parvibaculum sp.]|uniref:ImmA/IrrE family metallo-endopeptidase n=1 Tax=Parvibaculum sp. TaxID=2024848 RepID=UPI0027311D15|nr:ImmA/IrrE family metallo-endopeptidase [Parvibaculum sp.]MDP1628485.1 ImmA/IrrE family metallo-endopeptidase [Parvibaculum sp.]MDP2151817.1 ImmA/IrrE family metallo-endopeptidase [Parvibaculum sp.]MDP3326940.1 ImmA/IrrE family metallo-endopeptidase [Parvibaculum sp.]
MAKFQLTKARQHGERVAAEKGYTAFPVNPFAIAESEGILIVPKPAEIKGVSGGIIFDEDVPSIFYATHIESEGFQRFTVAHELGHYFLDGHPEEILKSAKMHVSRAGFRQGDNSIELEADHFASGLLMPTQLVKKELTCGVIGLAGVEQLANRSQCSFTAAAIRAAECSPYPMAIVVSQGSDVCYCFMSEGFKGLGKPLTFLRKGSPLPLSATRDFNSDSNNVRYGKRQTTETTLADWFDGSKQIRLDEEIVGLGSFGCTLTVFSSDALAEDHADEDADEEANLIESYTPKFAYGR